MAHLSQDDLYDKTIQTIGVVAKLPVVRVDREAFLRKEFADSPHLDEIISRGPQAVYTVEALEKKAKAIIHRSTVKTSAVSFAAGLPSNVAVMVPAGAADVASYFGFAINMAQQIAFLFGEDEIFDGSENVSDAAKIRIIAYLGVMFGAGGAAALVSEVSKQAGTTLGKKVASQALTKTAWYPVIKKTGALIGQKITKATVEKTITKAVPVVGGVVSGGLTFVTFRPMGYRLATTFAKGLRGEFDEITEDQLNPEFRASLGEPVRFVEPEPEELAMLEPGSSTSPALGRFVAAPPNGDPAAKAAWYVSPDDESVWRRWDGHAWTGDTKER